MPAPSRWSDIPRQGETSFGLGTGPFWRGAERRGLGWCHPKAVLAADFYNARYALSGAEKEPAALFATVRSSPHLLADVAGLYRLFGPNELAATKGVGAYIGGQATNTWLNSADLSKSNHVYQNAGCTTDVALAPDGTLTADLLKEDGSLNHHRFYSIPAYDTALPGLHYGFFRPAGREWITFSSNGVGRCKFRLSGAGAASPMATNPPIACGVLPAAYGYYLCWAVVLEVRAAQGLLWCLANGDPGNDYQPAYQGDGASGVYAWGLGYHQQSFLAPPILSGATAATRLASDVRAASLDWFAAAGLQAGFSVLSAINLSHLGDGVSRVVFSLNNGTTGNATRVYINAGDTLQMASSRDGAAEFAGQTLPAALGRQKIAFRLDGAGGVMKSKAGAALSATLPLPNGPTTLSIGSQLATGYLNDLIERMEICRPLTDGEMDAWVAA